ncbi:MAG: hypothetical protein PVSMB1_18030 [Gemmatimonadaceae bacterium]
MRYLFTSVLDHKENWRRRPDLNRGWRFCSPALPYDRGIVLRIHALGSHPVDHVLDHLQGGPLPPVEAASGTPIAAEDDQAAFEHRWDGALGCKTSEAAVVLLSQSLQAEQTDIAALSDREIQTRMGSAQRISEKPDGCVGRCGDGHGQKSERERIRVGSPELGSEGRSLM